MDKKLRGALGESLAAGYYRSKGCDILAANYRTRMGEVDIIARQGKTLVFCEVKTRDENAMALPREAVDAHKQSRLVLAAQDYIQNHCKTEPYARFDVVEVILPENGAPTVNCIENAFTL